VIDLSDDAIQPTRGAYVGLLASQAPRWAASDWTAFRLAPEVRGYLPLPWYMVLAARFAVGAMFVTAADDRLDATSQALGPNAYRLRGGGANSNRGFVAGELGAGNEGGLRRWESSLELRVRLGKYFGVVGFADVGDVNRDPSFRFNLPHPSAGFGLRYRTPVGPIRFDMGFRVGDLDANEELMPILNVPGAWHLTIGESF
jgi:outer membrane translocation and assembly module TamA